MINTLYLPEIREMLAAQDAAGLQEFCGALHPARTAEFMSGLTADECWAVLRHTDESMRKEIFSYFEIERQLEILETQDRTELASLIEELAADDRVDILNELDEDIVRDLLERIPSDDRRDILRLQQYPEGTAGSVMTTEFAKLPESLTVREALDELSEAPEDFETIYYLYIVDDDGQLRGLVSARQLVAGLRHPTTRLADIMETDLVAANIMEDREDVANKVANLDLLAIPVLDAERHIVGIITHDDIIDVVREEATEDAHRIAAVDPLDESYLKTAVLTLSWKRGIWLVILFFCALLTALALKQYESRLATFTWLAFFIPLIIGCGGNSGSQSATLIITALTRGHITVGDWMQIVWRELLMGLVLGGFLGAMGFFASLLLVPSVKAALVIPITILLVVVAGTLSGSLLPLLFERLGLDPAMMSNPFVAGIVDIVGIVIYMNVAFWILGNTPIG
jgi:magnesium transporter